MILIDREASQGGGLSFGDHHCKFELGNESSSFFCQSWVRNQQFVLEAFFDSDSGVDGIFKGVKAEAEWRISVKNIVEKLPALLDFEIVWSIKSSFVDSASKVSLFSFSFSTADKDV